MQIFNKLNINKNLVLALGFFDGVHLAHKKVLGETVEYAKKRNLKSGVITFKDSPNFILTGAKAEYISQNREKIISDIGIDYFYELDFSDVMDLSADEYLADILVNNFSPCAIFTGFNHTFGKNKCGNPDLLYNYQQKYGYKYFMIPSQKIDNKLISSTNIRQQLKNGNLEIANKMLGYNFNITGCVVDGRKFGRTIGYKTANLIYPNNLIKLPFGVYEVLTNYGKGISNFGIRPTFCNENEPILETHILNFDDDLYEKELTIEFIKLIRNEIKFDNVEELKEQIAKDISIIF